MLDTGCWIRASRKFSIRFAIKFSPVIDFFHPACIEFMRTNRTLQEVGGSLPLSLGIEFFHNELVVRHD